MVGDANIPLSVLDDRRATTDDISGPARYQHYDGNNCGLGLVADVSFRGPWVADMTRENHCGDTRDAKKKEVLPRWGFWNSVGFCQAAKSVDALLKHEMSQKEYPTILHTPLTWIKYAA